MAEPSATTMKHLVEVEGGREASPDEGGAPSAGPTYRCAAGGAGGASSPPAVPGLDSCWDIFRLSAEKYPGNPMLGRREIVDGKAGPYTWVTYKEVYDTVLRVGASIRSCGVGKGGRCGIYGGNCLEWVVSMQACNAHGIYCVPLYDTLGAGAIEFILCHAPFQKLPSAHMFLKDGRSRSQCLVELMGENKPKDSLHVRLKKKYSDVESDSICSICNDGGEILLCDHCPSSFHHACIGLEATPVHLVDAVQVGPT